MTEFFNVLPPDEARALLLRHTAVLDRRETLPVLQALGRITPQPLSAPHALPTFRRSTMDGYAVRAADTFGATDSLPAFLRVIGEIAMGRPALTHIAAGEAVVVHTGGMLPDLADAVVQVEHTQTIGEVTRAFPFEIEVARAVATGQNVLQVGEDVAVGEQILPRGHVLRAQDIGGLVALGITHVTVMSRPRVTIVSTGDELVNPEVDPTPGQIRDINSFTVAAQVLKAGAEPNRQGIVGDDYSRLLEAAEAALAKSDMLVISAGSSVSARDMTVSVVAELGAPGVLLHGVATRPGKPTIVGAVGGKPVLGLPGNPVSAMIQFDMFGVPAIYHMQGVFRAAPRQSVWARLTQNVPSESGREDYVPARLAEEPDGLYAVPVFGKSNLIYSLVKADGLLKIPLNRGGLMAGEMVELRLF